MKNIIHPGNILKSCTLVMLLLVSGKAFSGTSAADRSEGLFTGNFYVFYADTDPKMALRPSDIQNVQYNVITWEGKFTRNAIRQVKRKNEQAGDGFDDRILDGSVQERTADLFALENKVLVKPSSVREENGNIYYSYEEYPAFRLQAMIKPAPESGFPELSYELTPLKDGYYAVVYAGSPQVDIAAAEEIWQPMIWQEKRFPDKSYLTAAFRCPVPTAFVRYQGRTFGVVAHPREYPFEPLPLLDNSRFGVLLRTETGKASPMISAPVFGGAGSYMKAGKPFHFTALLYVSGKDITRAYEDVARNIYGFRDYRRNDICSMNETFDNIVDYAMSSYSWFVDDQKGCAYSTDVPGAVKNVSSLNPLELALVADRADMFERRAYPIVEYQLSREKFLFCADSTQKIQSPSRKMTGPIAPVSELTSLYDIAGKNMPFLLHFAEKEYGKKRVRNLEVKEAGNVWQNALWIYRATGDKAWLDKAKQGADSYIQSRVDVQATAFNDPQGGGFFFWTGFTPRWIDLLELYEATGEKKYLDAAHEGARHYTMFTWMSPAIPSDSIVVNQGGKAPVYWYLMKKGHQQMYSPEEKAPAWRLSEIGLTPESSGTCTGHRAIFMANYAAWMLRIASYTHDDFLREVAKAAVVGRYRNFPGYHINTARTTIYEKADYPLRNHKELSVNSFHYNHIMPNASLLLDYMVTDASYRSAGAIDFPSRFIEGYAYLQSKFYGYEAGNFYGEKAWLWMPAGLLKTGSVELNYISARSGNKLMIAFCNQSGEHVDTQVDLNDCAVKYAKDEKYRVRVIADNERKTDVKMVGGRFPVSVSADGITAVVIEGVSPVVRFQKEMLAKSKPWREDYFESEGDAVRAMILDFGSASRSAYVYLTEDDRNITSVQLQTKGGEFTDSAYPFEFTVPLKAGERKFEAVITVTRPSGKQEQITKVVLRR